MPSASVIRTVAKPLCDGPLASAVQRFQDTGDATVVVAARTTEVENAVRHVWQQTLAAPFPRDLAVVATGALGRRELFPYSDVDLLLLVTREPDSDLERKSLSAFLSSLWDQGIRVSHSVRTPAECCQLHAGNLELIVSLLDARWLAGDVELFRRFRSKLAGFLYAHRRPLAQGLCRLARSRHAAFQNTIYHLEPDIKQTPGGLRDLHLLRWLTQLKNAGKTEIPSPQLPAPLQAARQLLWTLRCFLHLRASRDQNRLDFQAQQALAEQPLSGEGDPAAWMRRYFQQARAVFAAAIQEMENVESRASPLLASFQTWRSRLSNADFSVRGERVFLRSPAAQTQDPERLLRVFEFAARHGFLLSREAERQLAAHLDILGEAIRSGRPLWPWFRSICSLPHAPVALRAMHQTGVLGTLFPEWRQIESLVVWDWYHRYTVDEHSLVSIEALFALRQCQQGLLRHFSELTEEVGDPGVLVCALLFHDTGKVNASSPHAPESARLARLALSRIGAPAEILDRVCWLIQQHLTFSELICARDPDDPSTAARVARRIGTVEALKQLILVSYADISAVNPEAMSPWRLQQLWRWYLATYQALTRQLQTERIEPSTELSPEMALFLEGLPVRYLRTHSPSEVEEHLRLYQQAARWEVALSLHRRDDLYSLTLITRDRPYLLACLAGALSGFGMNILRAEAFSNRQGMALQTFVFDDPGRTLDLNPGEMDRLRRHIELAALGRSSASSLVTQRLPQTPGRRRWLSPAVTFDSGASPSATLIEIVAQDRPGLLYELAFALSSAGCNIELVLADTRADRAIDVFYVTRDGRKLDREVETLLLEQLLKVCRA